MLNKLRCYLFGHKMRLTRKVLPGMRELKCQRCNGEYIYFSAPKQYFSLDANLKESNDRFLALGPNPMDEMRRLVRQGKVDARENNAIQNVLDAISGADGESLTVYGLSRKSRKTLIEDFDCYTVEDVGAGNYKISWTDQ